MCAKVYVCGRCGKPSEARTCAGCRAKKKAARAAKKAAGFCVRDGCARKAVPSRGGRCHACAARNALSVAQTRARVRQALLANAPISVLLQDYDAIL